MRFAYADPPYPGMALRHYQREEVDHAELLRLLVSDFPDGWALSTSSTALAGVLELMPLGTKYRIGAWVKPFHAFKRGVRPAYAWEPVIFAGGRNLNHPPPVKGGVQTTPRDWVSANITLCRGLVGAKPKAFCFWLFDLLNFQPGDELVDLYPGTGAVTEALKDRLEEGK